MIYGNLQLSKADQAEMTTIAHLYSANPLHKVDSCIMTHLMKIHRTLVQPAPLIKGYVTEGQTGDLERYFSERTSRNEFLFYEPKLENSSYSYIAA